MYGVDRFGHSVLAHIHEFQPYFLVKAPDYFDEGHLEKFHVALNLTVANERAKPVTQRYIRKVELISGSSLMNYQPKPCDFLKITVACPQHVRPARSTFFSITFLRCSEPWFLFRFLSRTCI